MAQGAIKKSKTAPTSLRRTPSAGAKKGQRTIAPKKKALKDKNKITKRYTSALIGKTERSLAEKAGHLELLGGGKKKGGAGASNKDMRKKNA